MTRVGVIGAGLMGSIHARLLASEVPGAELVAVADPDLPAAERLGAPATYADGLELIAADDVDAVVVASPVFTHEPFVLACIAAGKPVLCEKPLAATPEAARRIVEAERAARPSPRQRRLHAPLRPGLRRPQGPARRGRDRRGRCSCTARTATRSCTRSSTAR